MGFFRSFPIPHSHLLARIRIAILAQMRTGVVFTNVLAHHAAAELPLAFVAVVTVLDDGRFGIEEVAFGNLHAEEVHQGLVVMGEANHQVIIHAAVVLDAVWRKVNLLATGGQLVVPFLVEVRKPLGKFFHLGSCPFRIVHMAFFKIGFHLFI